MPPEHSVDVQVLPERPLERTASVALCTLRTGTIICGLISTLCTSPLKGTQKSRPGEALFSLARLSHNMTFLTKFLSKTYQKSHIFGSVGQTEIPDEKAPWGTDQQICKFEGPCLRKLLRSENASLGTEQPNCTFEGPCLRKQTNIWLSCQRFQKAS